MSLQLKQCGLVAPDSWLKGSRFDFIILISDSNVRHVVHRHAPLLPNCINWYRNGQSAVFKVLQPGRNHRPGGKYWQMLAGQVYQSAKLAGKLTAQLL